MECRRLDKDEQLKLDNQLCFTIYACSREMTRLYRPLLDEMNLTYPQYLVLLVLWETEEVTVKQLGDRLFLDSGTLTPLLKRMESANLITRERLSADERKVLIRLTEAGKALKHRACNIPPALLERSGLKAEEFAGLVQQFQRLLSRISEKRA
jgi:MarR family transcriptional regulator, organic hydroperoxide resistance regulator